jgi:serine protease Do
MKRVSLLVIALVLGVFLGALAVNTLLQGQAPTPTPIPKELTSYRDVVKKVLPAVVSIEAKAKVIKAKAPRKKSTPIPEDQVPEELRKFFEMPFGDDESPTPRGGFGSGFLVDPKGVILTNNHVVDGAEQVIVELRDGRRFTSRDIKTDPKTDLAIVRIQAKAPLPYLELGDSSAMEIGDRVLAVGAPYGLTGTVTSGIISAKGRSLHMNMYEDFLQTDAAINPGNSGGPLVNLEGRVIGINAAIKSRSGGFQGIGLAVSSNIAKNIMEQLLKDGTVHRGYLGVQIKDIVDPDVAARLGLKDGETGVLVTRVFDNTPGSKGGLKEGDVVQSLGGKPVKDGHELQMVVAALPLNKPVKVEVVRDSKPTTLDVTIEEQPREYGTARVKAPATGEEEESQATPIEKLGLEVSDLTAQRAESLGYPEGTKGVLITKVDRDSHAFEKGLRAGMVVKKVDKKSVSSAAAFKSAVAAGSLDSGLLLQVQTPEGGTNYIVLKATAGAR